MEEIIKTDHISFSYLTEAVLSDITLTINRGDFVGLIGPNGSGKTTLLKIILSLLKPEHGNVYLFGQKMEDFKDWHKIGYVPQKAGLTLTISNFPVTVSEIVGMGLPGNAAKESVNKALELVELTGFEKRLVRNLSGGEQQRVFIARALILKPELLILDEPTVGVDVNSQVKFYKVLRSLNESQNLTLLLVSHDIDVVSQEVKTVACLNRTLIFHGAPKDLLNPKMMEALYGAGVRYVDHNH